MHPHRRIAPAQPGSLDVELETGREHFDQVLVTTSPGLLARMAPDLPPDYLKTCWT